MKNHPPWPPPAAPNCLSLPLPSPHQGTLAILAVQQDVVLREPHPGPPDELKATHRASGSASLPYRSCTSLSTSPQEQRGTYHSPLVPSPQAQQGTSWRTPLGGGPDTHKHQQVGSLHSILHLKVHEPTRTASGTPPRQRPPRCQRMVGYSPPSEGPLRLQQSMHASATLGPLATSCPSCGGSSSNAGALGPPPIAVPTNHKPT